ncbi:MAG: bifunctional phosphoglucose/phosphomannose isomerase [Flavobacteriales bacterium]|nr:bifunctional phosphoglucose/phosphomannose isomerase [Flavobacteriales bacterium]
MKKLVEEFPQQLRNAVDIATQTKLPLGTGFKNVLITGLGGSGIGGTIAAELTANQAQIPVVGSKGYFIPGWVGKETLVIASSFSGNTEETINALKIASERNAFIVCVTSGGWIADFAREKGYGLVVLPQGKSPRAFLGASLVQLLHVLNFYGVTSHNFMNEVLSSAALIEKEATEIQSEAKSIADFLNGKMPVIYSTTYREGIAIRFRQQINENAKMLCWHHVVPEMNHNELVGWRMENPNLAVIIFRDQEDYVRNQKRIEINKEIIAKYTPHIRETWAKGNTDLEKAIWQIHLGDWVSCFLSDLRGVDAIEVKVIDFLKGELSKF